MKNDDFLFSKKRIKIRFNNTIIKKIKNISKIKVFFLLVFISIIFSVILFIRFSYPIFKASCENAASSQGILVINEEVKEATKNYTYNSLINYEKDNEGNVCFIETNTNLINNIVSNIVNNIQKRFNKLYTTRVNINMGTVSGISVLNRFSPNFEIILESSGKIKTDVKSEFKSVGINQTHHKIFLNVEARISILTPITTFYRDINQNVILTESIIVGNVPDTYYNLEGIENVEDTYNFTK